MTAWFQQHAEAILGATLGMIFSIPIGFYLSLYSGLIVARWARFEDLRYELIRILQSIDWPPGFPSFRLTGNHRVYDITLISADLFSLGHCRAGETVAAIEGRVSDELNRRTNFLSSGEKEEKFTGWMCVARTIKPASWPIFDPRLRLYRKIKYEDNVMTCERHIFRSETNRQSFQRWSDHRIRQMTAAISLMFAVASAALGYALTVVSNGTIAAARAPAWCFTISVVMFMVSWILGVAVVANRFYSFRQTGALIKERDKEESDSTVEQLRDENDETDRRTWMMFYSQFGSFVFGTVLFFAYVITANWDRISKLFRSL